jgi:hypothetical protein
MPRFLEMAATSLSQDPVPDHFCQSTRSSSDFYQQAITGSRVFAGERAKSRDAATGFVKRLVSGAAACV